MEIDIRDKDALLAVSPAALSAYARAAGWSRRETYRDRSHVYRGGDLPDIILPNTKELADYASVVSGLIETFAESAEQDRMTVYRDLVTADRDAVRVRAVDLDERDRDGSLPIGAGADLVCAARDLVLAAACALDNPRPIYRMGANREAADYLRRVRLGQTEQGSFVVTLLSPVVPPPIRTTPDSKRRPPDVEASEEPIARRVTARLAGALAAARRATDDAGCGEQRAFSSAVRDGVSANLCDALATLTETLSRVDIGVVWARTYPRNEIGRAVRFAAHDAPILREAGRAFRSREPRPGVTLVGLVQRLERDDTAADGMVTLRTSLDGRNQSVGALLRQSDYHRAIQAHRKKAPLVVRGDLERAGRRWRLLDPSIEDVIESDEAPNERDAMRESGA